MRLLKFPELKERKGIPFTQRHLRRMTAAGDFPAPVQISDKQIAWIEAEIDGWIQMRAGLREAKVAA